MKLIAITTISATVYLLVRFAHLKYTDHDYLKAFLVAILGIAIVIFMVKEWIKDLKESELNNN
jgi:hypothetical protein